MLQAERSRRALPGEETPHLVLFRVGREALLNALRKTANTATAETTASAASESEEKEGLASRRLPRPPRMSPLILRDASEELTSTVSQPGPVLTVRGKAMPDPQPT